MTHVELLTKYIEEGEAILGKTPEALGVLLYDATSPNITYESWYSRTFVTEMRERRVWAANLVMLLPHGPALLEIERKQFYPHRACVIPQWRP